MASGATDGAGNFRRRSPVTRIANEVPESLVAFDVAAPD